MIQRKLLLRTLAIALLFGLLFWLADSLAYQYYFSHNLRRMMFEPPETLVDAVLLNISAHTLFVRLIFLVMSLIGGWLTARYMNNLHKSEQRLRQVVENMPVMMDAFDEDANLVAWNRECECVTGYRAEEIVGTPQPLERLYPDVESREEMLAEVNRLGEDFRDREWTLICKDGTQKTVSWSNISDRVSIPGWASWAVGVDVTSRKQTEEALERRLTYERLLSDISRMAIEIQTLEDFQQECLRIMAATLDVSRIYIFEHCHTTNTMSNTLEWVASGIESQQEHLQQIPDDEFPWWMEMMIQNRVINYSDITEIPSEQERELLRAQQIQSILVVPLFVAGSYYGFMGFDECRAPREWPHDDVEMLVAASRIMTETLQRRRAEDALHEYSKQLESMVEDRTHELREAQDKLLRQEKLAVLGQLAGSVAHELRHPLSVLSNAAYYLNMALSEADESIREYLTMIAEEVRKSDKIISDLLDFSRNQASDTLVKTPTHLPDLLADVLAEHPTPEGIKLVRRDELELPPILVDAQQIAQVLTNLIVNAYQAMPEGGTLTVGSRQCAMNSHPDGDSSRLTADCLLLIVQDTGCGIAPEHLDKLFEPLFTTKPKGIGLGLAISKNLVETNGGRIEVNSQLNAGTTFLLTFPIEPGREGLTEETSERREDL